MDIAARQVESMREKLSVLFRAYGHRIAEAFVRLVITRGAQLEVGFHFQAQILHAPKLVNSESEF